MGKVEEYIEALKKDPKSAELLAGAKGLKNAADFAAYHEKCAKELGFELSADEIIAYMTEEEKKLGVKSEETKAQIANLSLDDLENVAGGTDTCKDSYRDEENCWHNDGCDVAYNKYDYYRCCSNWYGGASMCEYLINVF